MTTPQLPLDLTYAAIFGTPPGSEVAATLARLERYVGPTLTPATALMLCITLRPVDLYASLIFASERQLHDARLMFATSITEVRSSEALTIALQNETIRRLHEENRLLRNAVSTQLSARSEPRLIAFALAMLFVIAAGSCWVGLLR